MRNRLMCVALLVLAALPARSQEKLELVNAQNVRLRLFPTTEGDTILRLLDEGTEVEVVGRTESETQIGADLFPWYFVFVGGDAWGFGDRGWVYGKYITFPGSGTAVPGFVDLVPEEQYRSVMYLLELAKAFGIRMRGFNNLVVDNEVLSRARKITPPDTTTGRGRLYEYEWGTIETSPGGPVLYALSILKNPSGLGRDLGLGKSIKIMEQTLGFELEPEWSGDWAQMESWARLPNYVLALEREGDKLKRIVIEEDGS